MQEAATAIGGRMGEQAQAVQQHAGSAAEALQRSSGECLSLQRELVGHVQGAATLAQGLQQVRKQGLHHGSRARAEAQAMWGCTGGLGAVLTHGLGLLRA